MADVTPTILLTRPLANAEGFAAHLRALGVVAPIEISPIVEIEPKGEDVDFAGVTGVVFSSRNAVAAVAGRRLPAWCVGAATARAAAANGWQAVAADGDAEALYARVLADAPKGHLLHLRGEISRGDVATRLTEAGVPTREVIVYRQLARELSAAAKSLLSGKSPVIVPLFSPYAAEVFARQGPFCAPIHIVAMSEAVGDSLGDFHHEQTVLACKKDANAMAKAVAGLLDAG
ncbi:uroporphyrinogen-III synthase [Shimia sp. NS0008-38b]|uniref:uroporphyrinogen-III synthase n=1 Tax=Shimia sp. NS0008-38b TaxID=3127653 RepID=UPI00310C479B